jgi:hypothetical protein
MTQPTAELIVEVKENEAGDQLLVLALDSSLLDALDEYAEQHGLVGKEDEHPLRSRLRAIGQLLADGTTKAVHPVM